MNTTTFLGNKPINRIGFGAMQLAGPGVFGPPSDPGAARAVLRRAVELGVDHIDTSQYYGPDVVNELIGEALYPYPENLNLVNLRLFDEHDAKGHLEEQLGELEDLRQEGKLDLIGISSATAETVGRAL